MASATQPASNMIAVELRRLQLGVNKRQLCIRARIPTSTYYRLLNRPGSGRLATVERLSRTLDAIEMVARHAGATVGVGHAG